MQIRRCHVLMCEPRERVEFDLGELMQGGSGVRSVIEWTALAPHLDTPVVIDTAQLDLLGRLSPTHWVTRDALAETCPAELLDSLLALGLAISDDEFHAAAHSADIDLRAQHWHGLSAVAHRFTRWRGRDTEESERHLAEMNDEALHAHLGVAPPAVRDDRGDPRRITLPEVAPTALDALLLKRVTCRNFDPDHTLSADEFASVLHRVFAARGTTTVSGVPILKKSTPSAGGLHPTEAYVLVQRVAGIPTGVYHYRPLEHALQPLRELDAAAATKLATRFVAVQRYFLSAPVILVLTSRFKRNFWKYRNHAKAYRAVTLDAGHLSQLLYLAATELGLAAFITAAINEGDIEQALELDPMQEGVLAVCGFGRRGSVCDELELDPLNQAWPVG